MDKQRMRGLSKQAAAGMLGFALSAAPAWASRDSGGAGSPKKSSVEVVFVLDTTGSMSGLLEAAKQKIWSIANEIAKGRPAPDIKMGLIAYRDNGDAYVTKTVDLSKNLDAIYSELLGLRADGGGDGPEHVLKALEDSVERISWSKDPKTFRVVYLVGDAPAHLDYKDTPALEKLVEAAVRKGLIVNAIQCGSGGETESQWRKIARLGEGKYLGIAHDGGVAAVSTPFDDGLARLNARLDGTMLGYGGGRAEAEERMSLARSVAGSAPAPAAAERAMFKSRAGFDGESDLAQAVDEGKVSLEKVKESELPDQLKGLSAGERRVRIDKINAERKRLRGEIEALAGKRASYLKEHAAAPKADAFDKTLVESLKVQAGSKGIVY